MNDATFLQQAWSQLEQTEKRKIVEGITHKIVVNRDEIEIDLCYLPSSNDMTKRDQSLHGPVPFCHIRLLCSQNRKSKT